MESDYPVFNASQMLRFVHQDAYLKWIYADLLKKGHDSETALEVLFNGNVLEDSAMTDEYELYAKKGDKH
ncbi:hypothetical protein GCM10010912_16610 [Paenibacillus albidus]|uniref:Uncharacterized protein n=1 Tax=Paenibacillus albidus TaxID=2041023 RepID=A0A917C6B6_9BACL|nr:hypothetical protein [Paenibacillus albidus]GGF72174.1 hypothetical protein GCM10010912_16610 [Paenibacillus albidus]